MKKILSTILAALAAVTFAFGMSACNSDVNDNSQFNVYIPDGAPALSMAQLMYENKVIENVALEYNVVAADTIGGFVSGETPKADICVLPVNLASKLLGSGESYKLLGTVTHGNLYILSAKTTERLTASNLPSLKGKTVGVVNLANVPGLTLKVILNDKGIAYNESGVDAQSVYLKAIDPTAVGTLSDVDYYVAPEPAASTKVNAVEALNFVGDLQELYGGNGGYPQAVLVAKTQVIAYRNGEFVNAFMQAVADNARWILSDDATGEIIYNTVSAHLPAGSTPSMNVKQLSNKSILTNCAVQFVKSADCKQEVNSFLEKLIAVNSKAASEVSDGFFYVG